MNLYGFDSSGSDFWGCVMKSYGITVLREQLVLERRRWGLPARLTDLELNRLIARRADDTLRAANVIALALALALPPIRASVTVSIVPAQSAFRAAQSSAWAAFSAVRDAGAWQRGIAISVWRRSGLRALTDALAAVVATTTYYQWGGGFRPVARC